MSTRNTVLKRAEVIARLKAGQRLYAGNGVWFDDGVDGSRSVRTVRIDTFIWLQRKNMIARVSRDRHGVETWKLRGLIDTPPTPPESTEVIE